MKVNYTIGNFNVQFDADTQVDLWEQIAAFAEVFDNLKCAKCGSEDVEFSVRTDNEDNKYYELRCKNPQCRARLAFGQMKKGGRLFPKRKDSEGNWLPDNGWVRWNPTTKKEE